jgi:hypothetical protein
MQQDLATFVQVDPFQILKRPRGQRLHDMGELSRDMMLRGLR